jgi:DNA-binding transcriptional LysR family regulator
MSKFDAVQTLICVVEQGGFSAAARIKKISTAAISRQIAQLEYELGVKLLHRTTRQIRLTEAGQLYLSHCRQALSALSEAENALIASQKNVSGCLNVSCNRYFAHHYLIPKLPQFLTKYPQLKLTFDLAERMPDLASEAIDIIFGVTMPGKLDYICRGITKTRYVLCATPKYLSQQGNPTQVHDLYQHRYITHSMREPVDVIQFRQDQRLEIDPYLTFNDSGAMLMAALEGLGIVYLHDYVVKDALKRGDLIELLPEASLVDQTVYMYWQKQRYLQPKIRAFVDYFVDNAPNN